MINKNKLLEAKIDYMKKQKKKINKEAQRMKEGEKNESHKKR